MGYIPPYIISKLNELPITDVAEKLSIPMNSKGMTLCFMHNESSPSLHICKKKNSFHCYGCGDGGGVIKLVEKKLGLKFLDAVQWLIRTYSVDVPNVRNNRPLKINVAQPKGKVERNAYVPDIELLSWIMDTAILSELAKNFLFNVRQYSPKVVEKCGVKSITKADKFCKVVVDKFGQDRCWKAGVIKWNFELRKYVATFECPCLLFPFYDKNEKLFTIQGRSLCERPVARFSFPVHSDSFIFNLPDIIGVDSETPIYIAEGGTDCLALLSEGKKAIAIPGAGAFKEEYVKYLKDKNLFMYADNDVSGKSLFSKIDNALRKRGNYLHSLVLPPQYKDYSEYYAAKKKSCR